MSLAEQIVEFLRFYGVTSIGVLDLVFYDPNPQTLLQTIEYLVRTKKVVPGHVVDARRSINCISLPESST